MKMQEEFSFNGFCRIVKKFVTKMVNVGKSMDDGKVVHIIILKALSSSYETLIG
jgi:hypothetical protein